MARASIHRELFYQNLVDAGCDDQLIVQCMDCFTMGRIQDMRLLLSGQRQALLGNIHKKQKELDCLDFLMHKIVKEQRQT
ncbi:MAG: hypothetical protein AB9883_03880 [Acidaminococcaceae bacterium]